MRLFVVVCVLYTNACIMSLRLFVDCVSILNQLDNNMQAIDLIHKDATFLAIF